MVEDSWSLVHNHLLKELAKWPNEYMNLVCGKDDVHSPLWFLFLQFSTNIFKGNETPESAPSRQVFKIKTE